MWPTLVDTVAGTLSRARFDTVLVVLRRQPGGQAARIEGIEIRRARRGDAAAYERDIGTDLAARVEERLSSPTSACWIAAQGQLIVHASWVETDQAWVGEAGRFFIVPPGAAYIYESFTRPEMRGRGVYPAVLHTIAAQAADDGLEELWIAAERSNASSLRAIEKAGFERSFEVEVHRRWGRTHVVVPPGAEITFREGRLPR